MYIIRVSIPLFRHKIANIFIAMVIYICMYVYAYVSSFGVSNLYLNKSICVHVNIYINYFTFVILSSDVCNATLAVSRM